MQRILENATRILTNDFADRNVVERDEEEAHDAEAKYAFPTHNLNGLNLIDQKRLTIKLILFINSKLKK